MDIGKYIAESKGSFDLLGESSNSVYRIMLGNESCILKKNRIPVDNLSPFWYSIKEVFGSDFNTQRKNIYSLIMPDISGNQFVYSDELDAVTAIVDLDAYVIGPREWELAVVEQCLRNGSAFVKGYESYQEFPDITESRSFYRFFSYLCDPWTEKDLNTFMTEHILF